MASVGLIIRANTPLSMSMSSSRSVTIENGFSEIRESGEKVRVWPPMRLPIFVYEPPMSKTQARPPEAMVRRSMEFRAKLLPDRDLPTTQALLLPEGLAKMSIIITWPLRPPSRSWGVGSA